MVARAVQALLVAKVMVPSRSAFECCGWNGCGEEGTVCGGPRVDVNGSWVRVSWAFRVGLNHTAGSLGGVASPGYIRGIERPIIHYLRTIPYLSSFLSRLVK
jgi:hypothetical protein